MTRSWPRYLALPAAVALTLSLATPATAQRLQPADYRCSFVSPVFSSPWLSPRAFATGCEGPLGEHGLTNFIDAGPGTAKTCLYSYGSKSTDGVYVFADQCINLL